MCPFAKSIRLLKTLSLEKDKKIIGENTISCVPQLLFHLALIPSGWSLPPLHRNTGNCTGSPLWTCLQLTCKLPASSPSPRSSRDIRGVPPFVYSLSLCSWSVLGPTPLPRHHVPSLLCSFPLNMFAMAVAASQTRANDLLNNHTAFPLGDLHPPHFKGSCWDVFHSVSQVPPVSTARASPFQTPFPQNSALKLHESQACKMVGADLCQWWCPRSPQTQELRYPMLSRPCQYMFSLAFDPLCRWLSNIFAYVPQNRIQKLRASLYI